MLRVMHSLFIVALASGFASSACSSVLESRAAERDQPAVQENPGLNESTIERICQLVVDSDVLAPYYHAGEDPSRKPLYLAESSQIRPGLRLTKFGEPVRIAPRDTLAAQRKPFLEFTKLDVRESGAEVEFTYPVEGISGTITLARSNGAWAITKQTVQER